jgi:hypothetical protein
VSRIRFAVLGLCVALAACGEKFVAHTDPGGSGGTSDSGVAGSAPVAGGADEGGSGGNAGSAGAAGDSGMGEAGSDPGAGGRAHGGSGGSGDNPKGGSSGTAGSGGRSIDPMLPQDGLLVWLRADHGVHEKDGLVLTWDDQSSNNLNARQATVGSRPKYLPTGFNGRPTLEFDGQAQFLSFEPGFGDFSKGVAGLIVAKPTKSDCASMVEFSNGSEIEDVSFGMFQNKWTYEVDTAFIQAGDVDQSVFSLYAANHVPPSTGDLRINGATLGTLQMALPSLPASPGVRANNFVGHTLYGSNCEYFRGQISEIILYARSLGPLELVAIEKYLDQHWGVSTQDVPVPTP